MSEQIAIAIKAARRAANAARTIHEISSASTRTGTQTRVSVPQRQDRQLGPGAPRCSRSKPGQIARLPLWLALSLGAPGAVLETASR